MGKEIVLRYTLAVAFGCICISVMKSFDSSFDKVASTSLFACIISVGNEDESLGPVNRKGLNRFGGACVGGFCGYLCILLHQAAPTLHNDIYLIFIPVTFVFLLQIFVESELISTNIIKKYSMKYFVIQLQVAFGVVYIGDTVDNGDGGSSLNVAIARTSAILAGVVCLLLASLLAFPETSMQASITNLNECLLMLGELSVKITNHRIQGRSLSRYDHRQILFAADPVMDDQVSLLTSVNKNLVRVTTLLPHLMMEPTWVPGLPLHLLTAQHTMAPIWMPFLTVLVSRLRRIRSSLSTMDSNMRISSDDEDKEFVVETAEKLTDLIGCVQKSMNLVAEYIISPYIPGELESLFATPKRWKGDMSIKNKLLTVNGTVQTSIQLFALALEKSYDENGGKVTRHSSSDLEGVESSMTSTSRDSADILNNKYQVGRYTIATTASHRQVLGRTLDFYYKTGPKQTFCNLCIQLAIQTTSVIMETVDFISSLDNHRKLENFDEDDAQTPLMS